MQSFKDPSQIVSEKKAMLKFLARPTAHWNRVGLYPFNPRAIIKENIAWKIFVIHILNSVGK